MTISLDNVAVEQFTDQFTNAYQAVRSMLPTTVQNRRGLIGKAWHASVAKQFKLDDRGAPQSVIPPSDVEYVDVLGTFKDLTKRLPTDIFQQAQVQADERANLARQSAWAIARSEDQVIIDALNASATTKTIADGGLNLTVEKLREAGELLDEDEVPPSDRFFVAHVSQKKALLEQTEATSADFNTVRSLVRGDIDTFYGFKFIWIGNRTEGGIPKTGNIRTAFAYHMDSTIAAYALIMKLSNPGIRISFNEEALSHQVVPFLRMGAKSVLDEGIVKVNCDES